ncbi:hypothetical protein PAI11_37380 [Patulibacter medicamentivorans]|uniref:Uncharacterized protein n=1 Tax=Patulibacter medicamentivorans TaxID=1097667 RepID=H0EA64_9ACTN|nr:hypothetical protein [Patulibacter medicamentivorans]EHN09404.1 hypothetical protein PAI11_37380 [Patulibacter medicamentivorans]
MTLVVRHDLLTLEGCRREAWRLLGRIATQVTEASGQSIGGRVSAGKPESRPPTGPRGDTLEATWLTRFHASWDDVVGLRTDVLVCGAVYARQLGQLDSWAREHLLTDAGFSVQHDADLVLDRVIDCYPGWAPEEVAAVETAIGSRCDALWVRRARRSSARHPETGVPVPVGQHRIAEVIALNAAGRSQRSIAQEVGASKTTVQRILDEHLSKAS